MISDDNLPNPIDLTSPQGYAQTGERAEPDTMLEDLEDLADLREHEHQGESTWRADLTSTVDLELGLDEEPNTARKPTMPAEPRLDSTELFPEDSWEAALTNALDGGLQLQQVCTLGIDSMIPQNVPIHVHTCPHGDGEVDNQPLESHPNLPATTQATTTQDPSTQQDQPPESLPNQTTTNLAHTNHLPSPPSSQPVPLIPEDSLDELLGSMAMEAALTNDVEGGQQLQQVCALEIESMVPQTNQIHVHTCPHGDGEMDDQPPESQPNLPATTQDNTPRDPSTQLD